MNSNASRQLKFGATHTAATASEAIELVRELTHGVMADAVVVSPAMIGEADVGAALTLTRKGGTCVLTGPAVADHALDHVARCRTSS